MEYVLLAALPFLATVGEDAVIPVGIRCASVGWYAVGGEGEWKGRKVGGRKGLGREKGGVWVSKKVNKRQIFGVFNTYPAYNELHFLV